MFSKSTIVTIITSILAILIYSCSDESSVSTSPSEVDNTTVVRTDGSAATREHKNQRDARVYVYAITAEERIAARRCYSSVSDLDFPLSIRQVEMIEAGEVVEISDQHLVLSIATISFDENLHVLQPVICQIGIISWGKNIDTDNWSCIKCCAAGKESCCCDIDKDEGRWE